LQKGLQKSEVILARAKPVYDDFRPGDVRHSLADISKAERLLGYSPTHRAQEGLELAMGWYRKNL
jgi:UDP-N-acetylglucosamine 4-epimerase